MNNVSKGSALFSAMTSTLSATAGGSGTMEEEVRQLYSQLSTPIDYPFYYRHTTSLLPFMSDKYLSLLAPIIIYWVGSLWFFFLDTAQFPFFEKYRLHEPQEITLRNRVSAKRVVVMVLLQQVVQTMLGLLFLDGDEVSYMQVFQDHEANVAALGVKVANMLIGVAGFSKGVQILHVMGPSLANWLYWWGIPAMQFLWAFFVMDAWQYVLHRAFHESRFLYKHFHSHHHRLYVPYAFGALYNHPIEGLLFDSAGGVLSHACALMTIRQGILLFTFSTLKTVSDHGGYAFPMWLDPLHLLFPNTSEYHDVHHQMQGLKYNYSQPFFVHFDVLFGTRMSAEKFKKMREVNKKFTKSGIEAASDAPATSTPSTALRSADDLPKKENVPSSLRQRGQGAVADQRPEEIALQQQPDGSDLTVTLDAESYRAKAGTST